MSISKLIILFLFLSGAILLTGIDVTGTSLSKVTIITSEKTTTTLASFQSEEIAQITSFSDLLKAHWWKFLISLLILTSIITWAAYKLVKIKHAQANPDPWNDESQFREENLLHTLIDNMPDFIYIKDTESRFIVSNQKMANVHGVKSPLLMRGKTDYDYYPRELANKFYWDEQEIIASGKSLINLEEKGLNEKGEGIYLSTTKIPLRNNQGEIIGIVGIGRDITARKMVEEKLVEHAEELQQANTLLEEKQEEIYQQSEELAAQAESLSHVNHELEKLSIVARETDNVVIILDNEGNFEWVNDSFIKVYGDTLEEFIKVKGRNILESSFNPHINDIIKKCRATKVTIRYQSEVKLKDGITIWMQSSLTPILDDKKNIIRFVAVDSDITALKKAQERISHQMKEIEDQRDKLNDLNRTKDKFFSIIAHDLKNPFNSILGFADLLVKNYSGIEDDKKQEYIQLIHESSQYAYNLLENLLQWSRSQTDRIKFNPAPMDIFEVIDESLHMLNASLKKKEISFKSEIPEGTIVFADNNMVHAIIRNLLNNAIKFTPEGGSITISHEIHDQDISIHVSDNGIGMEQEVIDNLFKLEKFYSTTGTEGESGTGLGLIICHDFISKHNGNISIKSNPGKGSTFTFTLQLQKTSEL